MKKKINLENLTNRNLFGSFENSKIKNLSATNLHGGTKTETCVTETSAFDSDADHANENLKDPCCTGQGY